MPIWVANVRPNGMKRPVYMDFHFLQWSLGLAIPIFPSSLPRPISLYVLTPCSYGTVGLCLSNLRPLSLLVERAVPGILNK